MKTRSDPRHQKRLNFVQLLFSESFQSKTPKKNSRIFQIQKCIPQIDAIITGSAPQFPIEKISKVDVAILRLAIYELTVEKKEPPKVIIDEAVEIAKEIGGDGSPGFVNGALGTLLKVNDI